MIISRHHFDLYQKRVIERLVVQTPFRYSAVFQEEACFLYFKEGKTQLSSATEKLHFSSSESVLLKCGAYFADFIRQAPSGICL